MKKTILYSLLVAFIMAMAVPADAQKKHQSKQPKGLDPDVTVEALKKVLYKHQGLGADNFMETEIYPQFKKNDSVLTRIGRIYHFYLNDTTKGLKYIDRALAVNPKYIPAYVEKGNLYADRAKNVEDTLAAYGWYEKAVSIDPKNPLGYQAQAKILAKSDVDAAARKLEEILQHAPNYNVYVEIGAMYASSDDVANANKAIEAYAKVDLNRMTTGQIAGYITLLQAAGKAGEMGAYKRSDSLLTLALEKYPTDARLNRLQMQTSVAIQKYDQALAAADILFNKSDSAEVDLDDFMSYAQAYEGLKNYNKAIEQYRKCLDFEIVRENYKSDIAFENAKRLEERKKNTAWQAIAKAYDVSGYTDLAIEEQKKFIEYRREQGKLDGTELQQLSKYYTNQAEISMGEEQRELYLKSCEMWREIANVNPDYDSYAHANCVRIIWTYVDKEAEEGLAVSDAEHLIQTINLDEAPSSSNYLKIALQYISLHYYRVAQTTKARADYLRCGNYLKKLIVLDPNAKIYEILYSNKVTRKQYGL